MMKTNLFSFYNGPNSNLYKKMNLSELNDMIVSDWFKDEIRQVRNNPRLKNQLPYTIPTGIFETYQDTEPVCYSGIICIELPEKGLKSFLPGDYILNPVLICTNPEDNGLQLFLKINDAKPYEHQMYFDSIREYFSMHYRLKVDPDSGGIARPCYITCDSDAYYDADRSTDADTILDYLPPFYEIPSPPEEPPFFDYSINI